MKGWRESGDQASGQCRVCREGKVRNGAGTRGRCCQGGEALVLGCLDLWLLEIRGNRTSLC